MVSCWTRIAFEACGAVFLPNKDGFKTLNLPRDTVKGHRQTGCGDLYNDQALASDAKCIEFVTADGAGTGRFR
jgi:hypothetical protein